MDSFDSSRSDKKHPLVGTTIGQYRVLDVIAAGGMGLVLKACQLMTERMVALKLLPPELVADELNVKRLQREARALAQLNHPNIITTFDFGFAPDGQPFLVIEFVEGETLKQLLTRELLLPIDRAVPMFRQTADAMRFAHGKGVLHRDLKPQNIMICNEPSVDHIKVLDFGIAQLGEDLQRLTRAGEVVGSPTYMSPEQCIGEPVGERSDIYSLGVVMFEALTGEPPYRGTTVNETMNKKVKEPLPRFSDIVSGRVFPELLESVVLCCLARNPENRIASMADLKEQLMIVERMYKQGDTAYGARSADPSARRSASVRLNLRGESQQIDDERGPDSRKSKTINGASFLAAVDKGLKILGARRNSRQSSQVNNFLDELSESFEILKTNEERSDVEDVSSFLDVITQGLKKLDKAQLSDERGEISAFLKEMRTGINELKDYEVGNKARTIHEVTSFLDLIQNEIPPPSEAPTREGATARMEAAMRSYEESESKESSELFAEFDSQPEEFDSLLEEVAYSASSSKPSGMIDSDTGKPESLRGAEVQSSHHLLSGLDDSGKILADEHMQKAIAPRAESWMETEDPPPSTDSLEAVNLPGEAAPPPVGISKEAEAVLSESGRSIKVPPPPPPPPGRLPGDTNAKMKPMPPPPPPGRRPDDTNAKMKPMPPPPLPQAHKPSPELERVHVFSKEEKEEIARAYAKPPPGPGKSDPAARKAVAPPPLPAGHRRVEPAGGTASSGPSAPPPPPPGVKRTGAHPSLKPGAPPPPPGRQRSDTGPHTVRPGLKDPMIVKDEQPKEPPNLMPESSEVFTTETPPKVTPEQVTREWEESDLDKSLMDMHGRVEDSPPAKSFISGHKVFAPVPMPRPSQEETADFTGAFDLSTGEEIDTDSLPFDANAAAQANAAAGSTTNSTADSNTNSTTDSTPDAGGIELSATTDSDGSSTEYTYNKHLEESTSHLFDVLEDDFEDFDVDSIEPAYAASAEISITGEPATVDISGEMNMLADLDKEMQQLEQEEFFAFQPHAEALPPESFSPTEHEVLDFLDEIDRGLEDMTGREPPAFHPGVAQEFVPALPPQLAPPQAPPSLAVSGNPTNFIVNDSEFLRDIDQGIQQLEKRRQLEDGLMDWERPKPVEDQLGPWKGIEEAPKAPWHNRPKTKVWESITKPKQEAPSKEPVEEDIDEGDEFEERPETFRFSSWFFGNKKLVLIALVLVAIAVGSTVVAVMVMNSENEDAAAGDIPSASSAGPVAPPVQPAVNQAPASDKPAVDSSEPPTSSTPPSVERSSPSPKKSTKTRRATRKSGADDNDTASGADQPKRRRAYQTTQYADSTYDQTDAGSNMP